MMSWKNERDADSRVLFELLVRRFYEAAIKKI